MLKGSGLRPDFTMFRLGQVLNYEARSAKPANQFLPSMNEFKCSLLAVFEVPLQRR